jgi:hypothetical protein
VKRVAIIFVVCGLAAAGAFAGYKIHVSKTFAADESTTMFTSLPASAPVVVYVDAKTFRESSLYKKMIQDNPPPAPSGDYADFMKGTGFDFARDLDRVAIAIESADHGSKMTAVADGHFDQAKIAAYATLKGKSTVRDGKTYFEFDEPKDNRTVEMTFLSPTRVRISSIEISAMGKKDDKSAPSDATPEDYATRIARVAGTPLFAIADVRSWSAQANFGTYTDLIRSIKRYTLTATPDGDTLHIALEAECATADAAQQLGSTANTMKMLAPPLLNGAIKNSGNGTAAGASQLLNSIQITQDGTRVKLAFAITSDMLSQASHMGTAKPAAPPNH